MLNQVQISLLKQFSCQHSGQCIELLSLKSLFETHQRLILALLKHIVLVSKKQINYLYDFFSTFCHVQVLCLAVIWFTSYNQLCSAFFFVVWPAHSCLNFFGLVWQIFYIGKIVQITPCVYLNFLTLYISFWLHNKNLVWLVIKF